MKITRWTLAALLLSSVVLPGLPSRTFAQSQDIGAEDTAGTSATSGETSDRWWGVAGAAICGGEMWLIRSQPAIGFNPYVLAAGIAGCALGALDIFST
jgi:hypothetical protein